jgi:uncharacterized repeat protein (TIGR04076 family)
VRLLTWYEDIAIEVVDILLEGKCSRGHKVGETFNYAEDRGKMCPAALSVLYPYILGLQSGSNFPWEEENPDSITLCCPDYKHPVVYKITRNRSEEK